MFSWIQVVLSAKCSVSCSVLSYPFHIDHFLIMNSLACFQRRETCTSLLVIIVIDFNKTSFIVKCYNYFILVCWNNIICQWKFITDRGTIQVKVVVGEGMQREGNCWIGGWRRICIHLFPDPAIVVCCFRHFTMCILLSCEYVGYWIWFLPGNLSEGKYSSSHYSVR
jgi:hypothetical protein